MEYDSLLSQVLINIEILKTNAGYTTSDRLAAMIIIISSLKKISDILVKDKLDEIANRNDLQ